jgi:hypothetical protein
MNLVAGRESAHSDVRSSQRRLMSAVTFQGFEARTVCSGRFLLVPGCSRGSEAGFFALS